MASDQTFFSTARSVGTIYADKEGDNLADVRFCLCRYGEDVNLCLETFWAEVPSSNFTVVPVFAHGLPPRRALSTKRSILAALETIMPEPGSAVEQREGATQSIRPHPSTRCGRHWLPSGSSNSRLKSKSRDDRNQNGTEGPQGGLAPYQKVQGPMSEKKRETQRVRIPKLDSVGRVGAQIALLYRWARTEKMTSIEAHRLTQVLLGLKACLESAELEERLERLEEALAARDRPAALRIISNG
jgi:hypothetical protein